MKDLGFRELKDDEGNSVHFDEWTPPPHEHQYTIPVEWEYSGPESYEGDRVAQAKRVTKLRCPCGEETDR